MMKLPDPKAHKAQWRKKVTQGAQRRAGNNLAKQMLAREDAAKAVKKAKGYQGFKEALGGKAHRLRARQRGYNKTVGNRRATDLLKRLEEEGL